MSTPRLRLICNAAEGVLQLILLRQDSLLCAQEWPAPTRSTEIMAPALAHMLQELGCATADISSIACVYGPGSFTGIRLVLSTAAALRRALHIPVAPLDYLQALALSAQLRLQASPYTAAALPLEAAPTSLWVLTHARRGLVHCQPFRLHLHPFPARTEAIALPKTPAPEAIAPVDLYSLEDCAARINSLHLTGHASLCLGSGLYRNHEFFSQNCSNALFCGPAFSQPDTAALSLLAEHATYSHEDPEPLYIRPCDAVDNLPAMAARHGQDPAQSKARLDSLLTRPATPDILYRG